jgi:hypothetical protein
MASVRSRFADSTQSALSAFAAGDVPPGVATEEWNAPAPFASNVTLTAS